jgi:TrmH family RNA methyltransferase
MYCWKPSRIPETLALSYVRQLPPMSEMFIFRSNVQTPGRPKHLRAAMGAHFFLRIHENCDLLKIARNSMALSSPPPYKPKNLFEISLAGPTAFVFGNEGAGLSKEMIHEQRMKISSIPMPGKTESLNAAAAAAICFFEKVRQDREARAHSNIGTK